MFDALIYYKKWMNLWTYEHLTSYTHHCYGQDGVNIENDDFEHSKCHSIAIWET